MLLEISFVVFLLATIQILESRSVVKVMSQINFLGGTFPVSKNYFKRICLHKSCRKSKCAKKKIAKKPLSKLLALFIFILFYLECMKEREP